MVTMVCFDPFSLRPTWLINRHRLRTIDWVIGTGRATSGMDVAPEPDGKEESPHFKPSPSPIGDVTNAEEQVLVGLWYQQVVAANPTTRCFATSAGYWMWDKATGTISHSLLIPRAVGVIRRWWLKTEAGSAVTFEVTRASAQPGLARKGSPLCGTRLNGGIQCQVHFRRG